MKYEITPICPPALGTTPEQYTLYLESYTLYLEAVGLRKQHVKADLVARDQKVAAHKQRQRSASKQKEAALLQASLERAYATQETGGQLGPRDIRLLSAYAAGDSMPEVSAKFEQAQAAHSRQQRNKRKAASRKARRLAKAATATAARLEIETARSKLAGLRAGQKAAKGAETKAVPASSRRQPKAGSKTLPKVGHMSKASRKTRREHLQAPPATQVAGPTLGERLEEARLAARSPEPEIDVRDPGRGILARAAAVARERRAEELSLARDTALGAYASGLPWLGNPGQ